MNPILESLFSRKSVRSFTDRAIGMEEKNLILEAALQAPTAGNQVMYTILDIQDRAIKETLAETCDHQPFIAEAPMVLIFLADCRRWYDCYRYAGAEAREPGPGDLLLACEDALIAAQNTVVAAESLGIGSCYIGDIMENRERHRELLNLDDYVYPAAMLVYGYPTEQQINRSKPVRFNKDYIVRKDRYSSLSEKEARDMFAEQRGKDDFDEFINAFCRRKYMSDFSREMNRSAADYLKIFTKE